MRRDKEIIETLFSFFIFVKTDCHLTRTNRVEDECVLYGRSVRNVFLESGIQESSDVALSKKRKKK